MLYSILTIVGGLIAASSFIITKKPNSAALFAKVAPYQGILGIAMMVLGGLWLVDVLPHTATILSSAYGILAVAGIALDILIGFMLSFGVLHRVLLSRSPAAEARGRGLLAKLQPIQVPLGAAATVVGALTLVF